MPQGSRQGKYRKLSAIVQYFGPFLRKIFGPKYHPLTGLLLFVAPAFRTGAAFAFHIALRFGEKRFARKFQFSGLGVHTDEFHVDFVAFFQTRFVHRLEAFVVDFRDVEQGVLARHDFDECAERYDGADFAVVGFAYFRHCYDGFDAGQSAVQRGFVDAEDVHDAFLSTSVMVMVVPVVF